MKKLSQWWSGQSCPFEGGTWSPLAFSLFTRAPSVFSVAMRHSSWSQGFHNSLLEEQKPKQWTKQGRPTQTSSHLTHTSHLWVLCWHTSSQFKAPHTPLIIYSSKSSRTNYAKNVLYAQYKLNRLKILAVSLKRLNRQNTLHHQCNLTPLCFCIGSDLPNHETSLFSPTNRITFSRCSHAEKEFGRPMRNGPPSPRIMRTQRSPSEKHQQTGNHSL